MKYLLILSLLLVSCASAPQKTTANERLLKQKQELESLGFEVSYK